MCVQLFYFNQRIFCIAFYQIPFFPLIKKDLTFIHLGNDSTVDGLVNYEKLRMVAKEVRHVCSMAPLYSVSIIGER